MPLSCRQTERQPYHPRVSAPACTQGTARDFTRLVANTDKMTLMQAAVSELIHLEVESQASGNANQASDSINLH